MLPIPPSPPADPLLSQSSEMRREKCDAMVSLIAAAEHSADLELWLDAPLPNKRARLAPSVSRSQKASCTPSDLVTAWSKSPPTERVSPASTSAPAITQPHSSISVYNSGTQLDSPPALASVNLAIHRELNACICLTCAHFVNAEKHLRSKHAKSFPLASIFEAISVLSRLNLISTVDLKKLARFTNTPPDSNGTVIAQGPIDGIRIALDGLQCKLCGACVSTPGSSKTHWSVTHSRTSKLAPSFLRVAIQFLFGASGVIAVNLPPDSANIVAQQPTVGHLANTPLQPQFPDEAAISATHAASTTIVATENHPQIKLETQTETDTCIPIDPHEPSIRDMLGQIIARWGYSRDLLQ
eukprot:jgi/Hompol1/6841/HPOL_000474-RA